MKRLFLLMTLFLILTLTACSDSGTDSGGGSGSADPVIKTFGGKIEKGAFQRGASIQASVLDSALVQTGITYRVNTLDDTGAYLLEGSELSGLLDLYAVGFYFNENTNTVETSTLELSGLVNSATAAGNINIVSHIIKLRVMSLIKTQGKTFEQANTQAVTELYSTLNWTPENPLDTDISSSAKLLLLSAAVCKNRNVGQVSALLSVLKEDMEDGVIDISILDESFALVDVAGVTANMTQMYGNCPDIDTVKNQVLAYREIEDETVRQITVVPLSAADFYLFTASKNLYAFESGTFSSKKIAYVQRYLGVTQTLDSTINDFFVGLNSTIYFEIVFAHGEAKKFKQENGAISEVSTFPSKPVKNFTALLTGTDGLGYSYRTALDNFSDGQGHYLTTNNQRIVIEDNYGVLVHSLPMESGTPTEAWVVDYHIADSFTYSGTNYGNGIFIVWSNGKTRFHYCDALDATVIFETGQMW